MAMKITNLGKLPIEQKGKLPSDEKKNKNHKGKLPSQKRKFPIIKIMKIKGKKEYRESSHRTEKWEHFFLQTVLSEQ